MFVFKDSWVLILTNILYAKKAKTHSSRSRHGSSVLASVVFPLVSFSNLKEIKENSHF